jgi:NitT/TauT family transport system permease protein
MNVDKEILNMEYKNHLTGRYQNTLNNSISRFKKMFKSSRQYLYPFLFFVFVLFLWEEGTKVFEVPRFILPAPSIILDKFLSSDVNLWLHTRVTVIEAVLGFAIASVLGFVLAIFITMFETVELTIYPYLIALSTIPILAIAPLLILWFGFGMLPKIIVATLICFLPIVVNTIRGFRSVDYRLLELMFSLNANDWQVYRKIRFYTTLPYTFAALKVSISAAVVGAVVGEFLGSDTGLGYLIIRASTRLDTALLFMSIAVLAVLGVSLFLLVSYLEKKILYWYDGSTIL